MAVQSDEVELEFWEAFTPTGVVKPQPKPERETEPGLESQPEPEPEPEPGPAEAGPAPSRPPTADLSSESPASPVLSPSSSPVADAGADPVASVLVALQGLGFSEQVAADWVRVLVAQVTAEGIEAPGVAVDSSDAGVVESIAVMARTSEALLAAQVVQVQDLVLSIGSKLLAKRDVTDPAALPKKTRTSWRAQAKAATAGELELKTGVSSWEARHLVAIATSPGILRTPVLGALRRGEVTRKLVLVYQSSIRRLPVDQAARIADVLFGTDPDTAAVERFDVDGNLALGRPWQHAVFLAALKREIVRAKSQDEDGADQDRKAAHEDRNATLSVEDDGTARLTCSMSTVTGVAVMGRIDDMARRARKAGDPRTLAQLRSDMIAALLLHGTITPPGSPGTCCCDTSSTGAADGSETGASEHGCRRTAHDVFDEIITPEDIETLRALITATPSGRVDVIVAWEDLIGAVCATCRTPIGTTAGQQPGEGAGPAAPQDQGATAETDTTGDPSGPGRPSGPDVELPDFDQPHSRCSRAAPCRHGQDPDADQEPAPRHGTSPASGAGVAVGVALDPRTDSGSGRVAELIGWESAFITVSQVRQIVLTPGTQLFRVLTDAADGRCLERSIKSYTPDTQMRRQIRAADVYGRGPGSRRPAGQCELDHEKEWLTHHWTAETNLNTKAVRDHLRKTVGEWFTVMNRRRDITFTTLLGQIAITRGHDYRQYYPRFTTTHSNDSSDGEGSEGGGGVDQSDLYARRDLANQIIYAALVHRGPGDRAEAADDSPDSELWLTGPDWLEIHHTNHHGQRRRGTPPGHPTPEDLLHPATSHGSQGEVATGTSQDQASAPASPWTQEINDRPSYGPPPF